MKAEMKKILNAEQYEKWQKIQAEKSENKKDIAKKMHSKKRR
jgi:hypothetical protein